MVMTAPKKTRQENIIDEILISEASYNVSLQQVLQLVTLPLRNHIADHKLTFEHPEVPKIFDLLEQVWMVSNTLREEIADYVHSTDPDKSLAKSLQNFPRVIIIYFDYIRAYHITMPLLAQERSSNKAIDTFFNIQEEKLDAAIETFMITPVQRPPRYRLLFNELLKYTPADSPDQALLAKSVEKIQEEVIKLDHAIDEYEEAASMAELQGRLTSFSVFKVQRRLFFHGEATKFSRKSLDRRYLIFFSDVLVVAEIFMISYLKVNKLYNTGEYMITDVRDMEPFVNAIDIQQKTKSFRVNLKSAAEKKQVLDAFEKVKKMAGLSQEDLLRMGFAPVWIPDDQAPLCMCCGTRFSLVTRRHHCRSCGIVICKTCFSHKVVIPCLSTEEQPVCTHCFFKYNGKVNVENHETEELRTETSAEN